MVSTLRARIGGAVVIAALLPLATTSPGYAASDVDSAFAEAPATLARVLANDPGWAEVYGDNPTFTLAEPFDLKSVKPSSLITAKGRSQTQPVASALAADDVRCAVVLVGGIGTDSLYCVAPHPVTGVPTFLSLRELGHLSASVQSPPAEVVDISPFGLVELRGDVFEPLDDVARYHLTSARSASEVLNALGHKLVANTELALRGEEPLAGSSEPLLSSPTRASGYDRVPRAGADFAPISVSQALWDAVDMAQGVPSVSSATNPERELYVVTDGALAATGEYCLTGPSSVECHDAATETLRSNDMVWIEYPLPEGDLVHTPPHGWWVVRDGMATPADDVAAQYASTALTLDEFVSLATEGQGGQSTLYGIGWGYVVGLGGLVGGVAVTVWLLVRGRAARSMRATH